MTCLLMIATMLPSGSMRNGVYLKCRGFPLQLPRTLNHLPEGSFIHPSASHEASKSSGIGP